MSEGSASAPAPETPRRLEESSSSQQLDDEGNPIVEWPEPKTPLGRLQRRMWLWLDEDATGSKRCVLHKGNADKAEPQLTPSIWLASDSRRL